MFEQSVPGIIAEETEALYRIAVNDDGDCESCGLYGFCHSNYVEIDKVDAPERLKVGQKVLIEYSKVIQTSFIIYMLPVLFFFAGIAISKVLLNISNELLLFVNALIGTGLALAIVHQINQKYGKSKYSIHIKPIA